MKNIIVIKIGGSCIQHQEQLESLIKAIAKLVNKNIKFVIVHGGGVQADLLNQKLGIPIKKVNGRRITDSQTLSTVKMVYKGLLNTDLVSLCQKFKIPAVGFSGVDGKIAEVIKRPLVGNIDFGFVGNIKKINIDLISILLVKKYVPVITCLGINNDGQVFNINVLMQDLREDKDVTDTKTISVDLSKVRQQKERGGRITLGELNVSIGEEYQVNYNETYIVVYSL